MEDVILEELGSAALDQGALCDVGAIGTKMPQVEIRDPLNPPLSRREYRLLCKSALLTTHVEPIFVGCITPSLQSDCSFLSFRDEVL